ncbi:MAG: hypothetical protein ACM3N7_05225 [Planctomycetaceae bacterium]
MRRRPDAVQKHSTSGIAGIPGRKALPGKPAAGLAARRVRVLGRIGGAFLAF